MANASEIPAWIALFIGLYSLAAAIGEWRTPGLWGRMLADFERSAGLRFATGLFLLSLGAAIYMVNPWRPDDWLSILVAIVGGIMALEGALLIAMGDRLLALARWLVGGASRVWAVVSSVIGVGLIAVAIIRM